MNQVTTFTKVNTHLSCQSINIGHFTLFSLFKISIGHQTKDFKDFNKTFTKINVFLFFTWICYNNYKPHDANIRVPTILQPPLSLSLSLYLSLCITHIYTCARAHAHTHTHTHLMFYSYVVVKHRNMISECVQGIHTWTNKPPII